MSTYITFKEKHQMLNFRKKWPQFDIMWDYDENLTLP